jgi:hypothetical protein
MLTVA